MSYRKKNERNARLIRFWRTDPDFTCTDLAEIFHISRQRVHQILKKNKVVCTQEKP